MLIAASSSPLRLGLLSKKPKSLQCYHNSSSYSSKKRTTSSPQRTQQPSTTNDRIRTQAELTFLIKKNKANIANPKFSLSNERHSSSPTLFVATTPQHKKKADDRNDGEAKLAKMEALVQPSLLEVELKKKSSALRPSLLRSESDFLKKASFKVRNDLLDESGRSLLAKFPSLASHSVDPMHLTIMHESFAARIASLLHENICNPSSNERNVFVEYSPGFGLVTRNLINKQLAATTKRKPTFVLVETLGKFHKYLEEIKEANKEKCEVHILKSNPFKEGFLYKSSKLKYSFLQGLTAGQDIWVIKYKKKC